MLDDSTTQTADRVKSLLVRATSRAAIPYLLLAALLIVAVVLLGHGVVKNISAIEAWIGGLGPWGVVAFVILIVVTTSFLLPDSILCIASGALFGVWWGIGTIIVGTLLSAALQFALARRLFQARIQREIGSRPALAAMQRAVVRDEFRLQVLVRLTPINPAIVNYLLGATNVGFTGFIVACLALTPAMLVEVYLGHATKNMVELADGSAKHVFLDDLVLFGGLGVCIVVLVIVSRLARKALVESIADTEREERCTLALAEEADARVVAD